MNNEYSDYLKFIDDALELAKALPRYFSKFSNKIYCNHQKFAIYVLMQKFKTNTRGIVSILRASSDIRMHLGLNRVPVHTTVVRFVNRIRKQINKLLGIRQAVIVAVDATGFELESKSYYYRTVWNTNRRQKTKRFMKLSAAVDTEKKLILTHKIRKACANDTKDFKFLVKELKVDYILADKGYDSKSNRQFVINKLKAIPIIPVRRHTNFYGYLKQNKKIPGERYHQRSQVESIFSAVKRKYGSVLRNKTFATQKVELISKLIAYNLDRKQLIFNYFFKGCTRACFER
ncbi:MAG: transposase [Nanoarchaeota archaeon]|nr:transposase [Nanoarchaeota archaeon]